MRPHHSRTRVRASLAMAGAIAALALTTAAMPLQADGINWSEPLVVATGEAHVGPWRMNDSDFRYVDDPSVALGNDGTATVVWADQAAQDVFIQRFDREGNPRPGDPVNISRSGDVFSWLPRVVVAGDDPETIYVLWQEIIFSGGSHGGEILFARSGDGGRSFGEPVNLSRTDAGAGKGRLTAERWHNGSLDLAEGPDGTLWAAWTEYEGRLRVSRSTDGGASFGEPEHVAGDDTLPARAPSIVVDADGRAHLAWTVGEDPAADIRYSTAGGSEERFREVVLVAETAGHADAPRLATGTGGVIHLVHAESPDGPWETAHLRYTRARGGGEFAAPVELTSGQDAGVDSLGFPALAVAGETVHVLWERFPTLGHRSRGLGMMQSTDAGAAFTDAATVPGSGASSPGFNGSLQGLLMRKLDVNDAGEIAIVNSNFRQGEESRIVLLRGRPAPAED